MPAAFGAQLAMQVLEALDDGLIVCARTGEVSFANRTARSILDLFGGAGVCLPPLLHRALLDPDVSRDRGWSVATVVLAAPGGRRVYVKQKPLQDAQLLLLHLRAGVRRENELRELLTRSHGLSPRECDLVLLMRSGLRNHAIAQDMKVSLGTVKYYASKVYSALEVGGRTELIALVDRLSRE
jgi:DNA-binding CsgD family transcriptional regulator